MQAANVSIDDYNKFITKKVDSSSKTGYEVNGKMIDDNGVEVLAEIRDVLGRSATE